jgi:taurine dioxygenase
MVTEGSNTLIEPIAGALGAEIAASTRWPLDDDGSRIRSVARPSVVFFRDQTLSPEQLVAFGAFRHAALSVRPGTAWPSRGHRSEEARARAYHFGGIWHSDTTYLDEPPMGSMLYALRSRRPAAIHAFANMSWPTSSCRRHEGNARPTPRREQLGEGGRIAYPRGSNCLSPGKEARKIFEAAYPVVRTHPESGCTLYVNVAHTARFEA